MVLPNRRGLAGLIEFVLPELPEQPLRLEAERSVRGDAPTPPPQVPGLVGRIRLGGPLAVPITAASYRDTPELTAFMDGDGRRFSYRLVVLALTFVSEPSDPRLETADVGLQLSSPGSADAPVAWSMVPDRVVSTTRTVTSVQLGPQLKVAGVEASVGSFGSSAERERGEVFLEALGELGSDPQWHFRRTRTMELRGSHRLVMVVRSAKGAACRVDTAVRAGVVQGSVLRRYRHDLVLAASAEL